LVGRHFRFAYSDEQGCRSAGNAQSECRQERAPESDLFSRLTGTGSPGAYIKRG